MKTLTSTSAVIDAIGTTSEVAALTKRGPSAVSNWRKAPNFPPDTYRVLTAALANRGFKAPDALWRMAEPRAALSEGAAL